MRYKRFQICLADLNPNFGTEAGKTRPVLIIQSDLLNKVHPSIVVCPITTNIKKDVNILRVNIKKGEGGIKKDCAIMIDQIRAIDNRRIIKKIGDLPFSLRQNVIENIKIILDISLTEY